MRKNRVERGFTLLEIIVSLAIAAVGIAAVAKSSGNAAYILQATEQRMLANWVASNRLAELRVTRAWPTAATTRWETSLGGRTWYIAQNITNTGDANLRRVSIDIYIDSQYQTRDYSMVAYLSRYLPPEEESSEGGLDDEIEGEDTGLDDELGDVGDEDIIELEELEEIGEPEEIEESLEQETSDIPEDSG